MGDALVDVEGFRQRARAWLAATMPRRDPDVRATPRGAGHRTAAEVAAQRAVARQVYDSGFVGITWPQEYGGQGLTPAHERAFLEEARDYVLPMGPNVACAMPMLAHASPEFLRRHIPKILSGEEIWVQFFSEPSGGSDLAGVRTRATRDGERWILNGSKIWSTGAYYGDYGMCLARTDWDAPKHRGLTWFAVRTDAPGLTIQPIREISGGAEFCQEFFDDVEVGDDDVIGEVNQGWAVAQTMLVYERGGGGVVMPSGSAGPRELAPDLVALARQVGREREPMVRQLIARAHINDVARTELGRRVNRLIQSGAGNPAGLAAYAKLASGTIDPIRARIGVEIGKAAALTWVPGDLDGMTPALNYLNGRMMAIAGGTNEMQRNGIGERVLGLPREPSFDTDKPFRDVVRDAANWTGTVH